LPIGATLFSYFYFQTVTYSGVSDIELSERKIMDGVNRFQQLSENVLGLYLQLLHNILLLEIEVDWKE
jgi:hypothetical protein